MRYQGKVTNWKDDQGFGFVTPNGGGQKAFVHIKAFSKSAHRPADGDIITYELAKDESGRFFAKNTQFAARTPKSSVYKKSGSLGAYVATLFGLLVVISISTLSGRLPLKIALLYFTSSIITFLVYAIDKSKAQNKRWRIPESNLHFLGLIGGWPGAFIAQKTLHHKSKKEEFQAVFWCTVFINYSALEYLAATKNGTLSLLSTLSHLIKNGHLAI